MRAAKTKEGCSLMVGSIISRARERISEKQLPAGKATKSSAMRDDVVGPLWHGPHTLLF